MPQGGAEARKIINWNGGKHVVLDVILHIPVEKSGEPAAGVSAAAEAKIRRVRREADVLGRAAEVFEPATVKRTKVDDDD